MSKIKAIWLLAAGILLLLSQWISLLNPLAFWFGVITLLILGIKELI